MKKSKIYLLKESEDNTNKTYTEKGFTKSKSFAEDWINNNEFRWYNTITEVKIVDKP